MSGPLVSVVMGVRNAEKELAPTVRSVLAEDQPEIEFIVVDDGSRDGTPGILEGMAVEDGRLKVIRQSPEGLTMALIRGCAEARGEFIARQDAGDISLPGRFAAQAELLRNHPQVGFVSCRTEFVGPEGEPLWTARGGEAEQEPADILDPCAVNGVKEGPTHHGSTMFRAEHYRKVGGYRPEFLMGQDWDLWYRLAEWSRFAMVPQSLYRARIGLCSLSMVRRDLQSAFAACSLDALRARLRGEPEIPALKRARALHPDFHCAARPRAAPGALFIGSLLADNGDPRCRKYFLIAAREQPWSPKPWLKFLCGPRGGSRS